MPVNIDYEQLVEQGEAQGQPSGPANLGYFEKTGNGDETTIFKSENVHVLVAHYNFEKDPKRYRGGDAEDVENLRRTFQGKRNCNFRELLSPKKELLLELLGDEDQLLRFFSSQGHLPSVFILYILSHGDREGIIFTDHGDYFTTTEVFESLGKLQNYKNCLKFINFGSCRGELDDVVHYRPASTESPNIDNLDSCSITFSPNIHNMVVLYSTVETTTAIREQNKGSWLVQATCQVLDSFAEDKKMPLFLTLLQLQVHRMARRCGIGQTPEVKMFSQDQDFVISAAHIDFSVENQGVRSQPAREEITPTILSSSNSKDQYNSDFYEWKSDDGVNIRGRKAFVLFEQLSEQVRQLQKALSGNLIFETSLWKLSSTNLETYFAEATKFDPGVGCVMSCFFGQVVEGKESKEVCLLVEGEEFPLRDVIHKFVGPHNDKWIGKPKLFFVVDQKVEHSNDSKGVLPQRSVNISATNHSGWLVLVLQEEKLIKTMIELFSGDQLKKGTSLQQMLVTTLLLDKMGVGKILFNSTLQFPLNFPDWPKIFIKPEFFLMSEIPGTRIKGLAGQTFDRTVMEVIKFKRVWLLSSDAGAGKTTVTRELAFQLSKNLPNVQMMCVCLASMNLYFNDGSCKDVEDFLAKATRRPSEDVKELLEEKRAAVFLDGFDEIRPRFREKVLSLIKMLADKDLTLWISTRPQEVDAIKHKIKNTVELDICPLDTRKQVELLQLVSKKSKEECKNFIDAFKNQYVLGNALHLTMFAQCNNAQNLYQVYDQVVRQSVEKYLVEKQNKNKENEDAFAEDMEEQLHVLREIATRSGEELELSEEDGKKLNEFGMMMTTVNGRVHFVHNTFAEFLSAQKILYDAEDNNELELFIDNKFKMKWYAYEPAMFVDSFYSTLTLKKLTNSTVQLVAYCRKKPEFLREICLHNYNNMFGMLKSHIRFERNEGNDTIYVEDGAQLLLVAVNGRSKDIAMQLVDMNVIRDEKHLARNLPDLLKISGNRDAVDVLNKLKEKYPNYPSTISSMKLHQSTLKNDVYGKIYNSIGFFEFLLENGVDVYVTTDVHDFSQDWEQKSFEHLFIKHIEKPNLQLDGSRDLVEFLFLRATARGNLEVAKYLREKYPQRPGVIPESGITVLHRAAWNRSWKMCEWLVKVAGMDLNILDPRRCCENSETGCEPGYWTKNDWLAHDHLMMLRGDVSATDPRGKTALHCASMHAESDLVQQFLDSGAGIDVQDNEGKTALMSSFKKFHSRTQISNLLLEQQGTNIDTKDSEGKTALFYALEFGSPDISQKLLDMGANINAKNNQGMTPLFYAVRECSYDEVEKLLDLGANLHETDNEGKTALFFADTDAYKLIARGADIHHKDNFGRTALLFAASENFVLINLVDLGADLNAKDDNGWNVMHHAISASVDNYGSEGIGWVKYLHEKNSELAKGITNDGSTVLHLAVKNKSKLESIKWTKAENIVDDVNAVDNGGRTPLHVACIEGNTQFVKDLLDNWKEVDLTLKDKKGWNALHLAAKSGKLELVKFLLEMDSQLLQRDGLPVSVEELSGDEEIQIFLRNWLEARTNQPSLDHTCLKSNMAMACAIAVLVFAILAYSCNNGAFGSIF